jgi:hypothetical protein
MNFKFGMMIVHDQQMNLIDFEGKGLKVKFTSTLSVKTVSAQYIKKA